MSARRRSAGHVMLTCDIFGCDNTHVAAAWMNGPAEVRLQAERAGWKREMRPTPVGYRHFDICTLHETEPS